MKNLFVLLLTIVIGFGFYKQTEAEISVVDEPCQNEPCNLVCQYGYTMDSFGCKVCACEDPCWGVKCSTNSTCRPTKLLGSAENKYTGQCTNRIECPDTNCKLDCIHGKTLDLTGCRTCNCLEPCAKMSCPVGEMCKALKIGSNNDFELKCVASTATNKPETECKDEPCNLACQYGYTMDSFGCKVCACEDPCWGVKCSTNSTCRPTKLLGSAENKYTGQCTNRIECPDTNCKLDCIHGNTLDLTGCRTCNCLEPCAKMSCPVGEMCKALKIGSNNDFELKCVASTSTNKPETACPHIQCSNPCDFGYMKENGCDSCNCAPDPCSNTTCPYDSKCYSLKSSDCVPVENPCLELECGLECLGLGEFNKYKLNCSTCRCDNPCINAKCDNSMCFLEQKSYVVNGKEVKVKTGSCSEDQKCPSLPCNPICSNKDKFGCPSCLCGLTCNKTDCGTNKYCKSTQFFKMRNSSNVIFDRYEVVKCEDCPKLNCSKYCLYGWSKCETCDCAANPCENATSYPDKSCQALFFPNYAEPLELSIPSKNTYQDYIYLDKGDGNCIKLRDRYEEYFNLKDPLNCDSEGNFKPLQCSGDLCWCLDKFGNHTGSLEADHLHSIACGYYSKGYFQIISLDDLSVIDEASNWRLKIDLSKELAQLLQVEENQIIITSIGKTKDSELKFIALTSTKQEEESLAAEIRDLSMAILNLTYEGQTFRFNSIAPIILETLSTTNTPIILPTTSTTSTTNTPVFLPTTSTANTPVFLPTTSTTNTPVFLSTLSTTNTPMDHPIGSSSEFNPKFTLLPSNDSEAEETTKLLLLIILLPILVAFFVFIVALIIGLFVVKRFERRPPSTTGSLFKEPIIFPENPKLDFDYHPYGGSSLSDV